MHPEPPAGDPALDALAVGLIVQSRDGRIVRWNRAAEEILGRRGAQLAGRTPPDAATCYIRADGTSLPPEDLPAMRTLRTGEPVNDFVMGVCGSDGTRWLSVGARLCPEGVVSTLGDITERVARNQYVERSLEIERALHDVARDMLHFEGEALDGRVSAALGHIGELLGIDGIRAFALDEDGVTIHNPYWWGAAARRPTAAFGRDEIATLIPHLVPAVVVLHVDELAPAVRAELVAAGHEDTGTVLAVSLSTEGNDFGALTCQTAERRAWEPDDVAVVQHVAAILSGLLANRRAATSRRRIEGFLETILAGSPDVILVIDRGGNPQYLSSGATRLLGYAPEDLLGKPVLDIVHPEDRDAVVARLMRAFDGTEEDPRSTIELRVRSAAGDWMWMECNGEPLLVGSEVEALVVNARDITDRREQRAELEDLVRRFTEVWEHSPIGMALVSIEGMYLDVNPAHCRLVGYSREQLVGEHVERVVHSEDIDKLIESAWASMAANADRAEVDVRLIRADGEFAWARVGISVVFGADGEPSYAVATVEDITERVAMQHKLQFDATHDALTGLPQREVVQEHLARVLAASQRTDQQVAVMFVDLDHFKRVNDTLGHAAGDQLLQQFGVRLQAAMRAGDMAARHSGDEFVVVCTDIADSACVGHIAQRVLASLDQPFTVDGIEVFVHASVGIAVADDEIDAGGLIRRADAAAYRAKERGRNRYEVFDDELRRRVTRRLDTEGALRQALANDELTLHYQPIVHVTSGRTAGVEGLVRWNRPGHGILAPHAFLDVAEDAGLIVGLGRVVLEIGCAQLAWWQQGVWPDARLALNLSTRQLVQADFVDELRRCVDATGVDPAALYLEITETSIMDDVEVTLPILRAIKEMGVGLSIDDFGTGYSSLSQLQRLPVDVLKLDRSFVQDLGGEGAAIVSSVTHLAHTLGKHVVAEGVEQRTQADALAAIGCEYMQGYYFSRPVPADVATAFAVGADRLARPRAAQPAGTSYGSA